MPKSKSKRSTYVPPPAPRPKRSPKWLAPAGLATIIAGVVIVILAYFVPQLPGGNFNIVLGFVLMAVGLGLLSQWR